MVKEHLAWLGLRAKDRVTDLEGVVVSISFDLYGCVQAVLNPGLDKDGKQREQTWYDIARLVMVNDTPVMRPPDYHNSASPVAQGLKGPAEKPAFNK